MQSKFKYQNNLETKNGNEYEPEESNTNSQTYILLDWTHESPTKKLILD